MGIEMVEGAETNKGWLEATVSAICSWPPAESRTVTWAVPGTVAPTVNAAAFSVTEATEELLLTTW